MTNHPNRGQLVVDIAGPWRLYAPVCPVGWTMVGTVQRGAEIGALGLSPAGVYCQINSNVVVTLDQRKVAASLQEQI